MKPDWEDAPSQCNWLAQDQDGRWWWFEKKPAAVNGSSGWWRASGDRVPAVIRGESWKNSLEKRTEVEES